MRIAVDAVGTDSRPAPDVHGAVLAAREFGDEVLLIGPEDVVRAELAKHDVRGLSIDVVHAPDTILMEDKPSAVMKEKSESSIHVGMNLVKTGDADAFVSMGNTGAVHAIATLSTLRRISGVKRPALTGIYPVNGHPTIFLDVGANADCKPDWLAQFAIMGNIYAEKALRLEQPRIATLSNGQEEGKGNQLTRETQVRMRDLNVNYVGHIEPKEIMQNKADVVVVDGFVGNIFVKTFEASMSFIGQSIRQQAKKDPISMLGALFMRGAFRRLRQALDPAEIGGAPLLGVNGVVIIGHGGSDAFAIKNAIRQARLAVEGQTVAAIREGIEHV